MLHISEFEEDTKYSQSLAVPVHCLQVAWLLLIDAMARLRLRYGASYCRYCQLTQNNMLGGFLGGIRNFVCERFSIIQLIVRQIVSQIVIWPDITRSWGFSIWLRYLPTTENCCWPACKLGRFLWNLKKEILAARVIVPNVQNCMGENDSPFV